MLICEGKIRSQISADVAELADARGLGPRGSNALGVQIPPSALYCAEVKSRE